MRPSDADDHIKNWWHGASKMYKYIRLGPIEYICIKKDGESFLCDAEKSSMDIGKLTADQFKAMLVSGELEYMESFAYSRDGRYYKTGGCTCGAWAVKDSGHSSWCDKKDGGGFK